MSNLSFSKHCIKIASEASRKSRLVHKAFTNRNSKFLVQLYKTFVRPKLEYAAPIWNPYMIKDICVLESVQRVFTLRLPGMRVLQGLYLERLKRQNLETLEYRRLVIDLQYVYRIFYGLIDLNFDDFFQISIVRLRGNDCKLFIPALMKNLNCRKFSFAIRTLNVWNSLPNEIVTAKSPTSFTNLLKTIDLSEFLKF